MKRRRVLAVVGALGLAMGGCYSGYHNYPVIESAELASRDPNLASSEQVVTTALKWVVTRYPPPAGRTNPPMPAEGRTIIVEGDPTLAINLTQGVRAEVYERVSRRISASTGYIATPLTEEALSRDLPIYHVGRIWVRQRRATVDVFRPVYELPRNFDGTPVYQCVQVELEGGFKPWVVRGTVTREPGFLSPPPLYTMPLPVEAQPASGPANEQQGWE